MAWMALWWLIGIALVVVLVRALLVPRGWLGGPRGNGESPEQILKRRYAAGEIDRDTYERMRHDLTA